MAAKIAVEVGRMVLRLSRLFPAMPLDERVAMAKAMVGSMPIDLFYD